MRIAGIVKDATDNTPLGGVTVKILANSNLLTGAITDPQGKFLFGDIPFISGMSAEFSSIGYSAQSKPLSAIDNRPLLIAMKPNDAVFESAPIKPKGEAVFGVAKKSPMLVPIVVSISVAAILSITGYILYKKFTK